MKKRLLKKLGYVCMCFALLFSMGVGLKSLGVTAYAAADTKADKYSKEEIFQGIFFGAGDYGSKLYKDLYKQLSMEQKDGMKSQEFKDAVANITEFVAQEDPAYLDQLVASIEAQNPYQVDQALQQGGKLLYSALNEHAKELNLQPTEGSNPTAVGTDCLVYVLGVVAVYYLVAGAQVAVAALYVGGAEVYLVATSVQYVSQAAVAQADQTSTFDKEQLVQNILTAM
ncbi:MAG TPA: hypothetical protein VFV52_10015 [Bacilli bacterium]|nr:hypothetical protein [Bacilli bacterium]